MYYMRHYFHAHICIVFNYPACAISFYYLGLFWSCYLLSCFLSLLVYESYHNNKHNFAVCLQWHVKCFMSHCKFPYRKLTPVPLCILSGTPLCHVIQTWRQPAIDPGGGNSLTQSGRTFQLFTGPSRGLRLFNYFTAALSILHHLLFSWIKTWGKAPCDPPAVIGILVTNGKTYLASKFPSFLVPSSRGQELLIRSPDHDGGVHASILVSPWKNTFFNHTLQNG